MIKMGFRMKLPEGAYGRIVPQSVLTLNNKITMIGGVIDTDYIRDIKLFCTTTAQMHSI